MDAFQASVNELAVSDYLKFTMEIWDKDKDDGMIHERVKVKKQDSFPDLDMEMYWSENDEFFFVCTCLKENQQLKYLNKGSTHTKSCFQAIPLGVLKHFALLTMRKEDTENMKMDELYPHHAKVLRIVKLVMPVFLTLGLKS